MADIYSKSKRSEIMSRIRNKRTSAEDKVADLLRILQVNYRRNVGSLPGEPDLVVSRAKTAIFVHGCFWHNHSNCRRARLPKTNKVFWKKKIEENKRRDARAVRKLRKDGWHVLTFWQCTLSNEARIIKRLEKALCEVSDR